MLVHWHRVPCISFLMGASSPPARWLIFTIPASLALHADLWSGSAAAAPAAEAGKVSLDIKDGAGDKAKKGGCC